jgi:hypothetical protein
MSSFIMHLNMEVVLLCCLRRVFLVLIGVEMTEETR